MKLNLPSPVSLFHTTSHSTECHITLHNDDIIHVVHSFLANSFEFLPKLLAAISSIYVISKVLTKKGLKCKVTTSGYPTVV